MAKDSDSVSVPFDLDPLVSEDQGGGSITTSKLSNLQMLESFYAERMDMLRRLRERANAQSKLLNNQNTFESALMAATSLSLLSFSVGGVH